MLKAGGMGRRADVNEDILWLMGEMIFVIIFALGVYSYVASVEHDTLLEKNYLSRDVALLVDTIYAAPGNVVYDYSHDLVNISEYSFTLKSQRSGVLEKGGTQTILYWYADDKKNGNILDADIRMPESIKLCNTGGKVTAGREQCGEINTLQCPEVETKTESVPLIILNPVYGGKEKGLVSTDQAAYESEYARGIARSLNGLLASSGRFRVESTRDLNNDLWDDSTLSQDERTAILKGKDYAAVITIGVGDYSPSRNPVTAYMATKHSVRDEKLACMIENFLAAGNMEVTSISPVLSSGGVLSSDRAGAVHIELDIGNIENYHSSVLADPDGTAKIIYDAIAEYYGKSQSG
jgi:hypothetical protein